jgi:tetratricopeptide (TPR) repeat protein
MTWRYGTHCYASLGQLALLRGDADAARRFAEQSLEAAPPASSPKYEGWAWRIRGESAVARRAWGEAEDALRRALAIAEAIGQPRQTWQSHAALARLHAACGRLDEARAGYRAAWAIFSNLRERTKDPGLRAGLASLPAIGEIEDRARL